MLLFHHFFPVPDAKGFPVVVFRMDNENTLSNLEKLKAMLFAIEHGLAAVQAGQPPTITLLIDFKGFGRRHVNPKLGT